MKKFRLLFLESVTRLSQLQYLPLLLIRLILGAIFIQTGFGKLMHFSDTVTFFAEIGLPFPAINAGLASSTEFVGGLCLLLGFATRLVAIPLAFIMVVAILTVQIVHIHSIQDLIGIQEMDYLLIFILFVFSGAGKVSVDAMIKRSLK